MPRCLKMCEDDPEAGTNMQSLDYHQTVSPNSNEDAPQTVVEVGLTLVQRRDDSTEAVSTLNQYIMLSDVW